MARIRTIKPEFPEDETLGKVSRDARLLFVLLWTRCDDHGRFRASPAYLRGQLYPFDLDVSAAMVGDWLQELEAVGRVVTYSVRDERYGAVSNWAKHQRVDNAGKPLCPPPPSAENGGESPSETKLHSTNGVSDRSRTSPTLAAARGNLRLDLDLDPDPDQDQDQDRGGAEIRGESRRGVPEPAEPREISHPLSEDRTASAPPRDFGAFWALWPAARREGRNDAQLAWKSALRSGADADEILSGLAAWVTYWKAENTEPRFMQMPARWLRNRRWEEAPPAPAVSKVDVARHQTVSVYEDFLAKDSEHES